MIPLAGMLGGGGGLPGMSDQSMSSATSNVNMAGMTIGGRGAPLDSPAFLRARLGGATVAEAGPDKTVWMIATAGALLALLLVMRKKG